MIEALGLPGHRTSRLLFCALKVGGILSWLVGLGLTLDPLSTDGGHSSGMGVVPEGTKRAVAILTLGAFLLLGVLLLALAQVLRYLASIAEATGRQTDAIDP